MQYFFLVLNTSDATPTSVVYQSTGAPTFYTTTGSPFQGTSTYLPSQTTEERKDYVRFLTGLVVSLTDFKSG